MIPASDTIEFEFGRMTLKNIEPFFLTSFARLMMLTL